MTDLSDHLDSSEIRCKDGCGRASMSPEFLDLFEIMRKMIADFYGYQRPIICTSVDPKRNGGNRCPARNKFAGGARRSEHMNMPGTCLDVFVAGMSTRELAWWARAAGFTAIGIYTHNIHMGLKGSKKHMVQWGPLRGQYQKPIRRHRKGV